MTQITLNESQVASLENGLYRYHGIFCNVREKIDSFDDEMGSYYRIFLDTDDGLQTYFVTMSILPNTIQDLFWAECD